MTSAPLVLCAPTFVLLQLPLHNRTPLPNHVFSFFECISGRTRHIERAGDQANILRNAWKICNVNSMYIVWKCFQNAAAKFCCKKGEGGVETARIPKVSYTLRFEHYTLKYFTLYTDVCHNIGVHLQTSVITLYPSVNTWLCRIPLCVGSPTVLNLRQKLQLSSVTVLSHQIKTAVGYSSVTNLSREEITSYHKAVVVIAEISPSLLSGT